ncbi:Olfactory receptor 9G4 [Galemys pyrenaicus]|uniref:Olfactory receptor 9G4 n=1 Tax=Galemys pyrenaicus TaxID=202257 RepID=A0A8J6A5W4_GALPY|nr:Olfactory receptor 9G4 [Galemys pyrenaicus]
MDEKNFTQVKEFILLRFTTDLWWQRVLFFVFLMIYIFSLLGNITLISLICVDSRLHTPMYFFIGNLSFLDLWYSSVYAPKILMTCISDDKSISFAGCLAQFFFSAGLAYSECYLLAAMAYDRYMAISNPLLYSQTMSSRLCSSLIAASYLGGFINSTIITSETFTLSFCGNNVIDDFFCDLPPLVKLACDVKGSYQAVLYFILASNVIIPTVLILASYLFIIGAILKIYFAQSHLKAFSTCGSYLTAVTLYYGSILFIYSRPSTSYALERDKVVSVFYTVVIPMLNPLIYSLRNKDVKVALRNMSFFSADMELGNLTILTEFILVGFSANPQWQMILFRLFLMLYLITLSGNMTLIILIRIDSRLHTPMYFFIGNLSFLDFWYTSVYTPKILATCISEDKCISLAGCDAQLFFSCVVAYTECYLLAAMAYDCYTAICNPSLYSSAMSSSLCIGLVAGSYIGGFLNAIAHTANTFRLSFCGKNIIDHFFCDAPPLVKMSCIDTQVYEKVLGVVGFTVLSSILVILIAYFNIFQAILKIRTAAGRRKAFSTCASHMAKFHLLLEKDKVAALFYMVVNPLLNPLIYSMRNKDVKEAFWKAI